MHMLKLLFQKLQIRLTTPGRDSQTPGAPLKTTTWGQVEASGLLCSRERQTTTCPWEQLTAQGDNTTGLFFFLI